MAGISAMTTIDIMRFESMASWMWAPLLAVVSGTKRKVSKPSKTLRRACSRPPSSKFGLILSKYFLNAFIFFFF